jgi:hypothetical protein
MRLSVGRKLSLSRISALFRHADEPRQIEKRNLIPQFAKFIEQDSRNPDDFLTACVVVR